MALSLIQWGINDIDFMKMASSVGVETLLNRVPSWVFSTKKIGIVVGACVRMGWGVSDLASWFGSYTWDGGARSDIN
jgi:hypothetical protein